MAAGGLRTAGAAEDSIPDMDPEQSHASQARCCFSSPSTPCLFSLFNHVRLHARRLPGSSAQATGTVLHARPQMQHSVNVFLLSASPS